MGSHVHSFAVLIRMVMQRIAFALIVIAAILLLGYSVGAALGMTRWLVMPLNFGDVTYPMAGQVVQLSVTGFAVLLCFFLPTNARIMALESSHRSFHMGMKDVARAYALSHQADREGNFRLKGEFDSIRERIAFLRDHPNLADLEPSILELASQMSHVSHELAETYSDRNLARARDFLVARQQEIDTFNERIEAAKSMAVEVRRWTEQVELEEKIVNAQLERLRDEMVDLLPELVALQPPTGAAPEDTGDTTAPHDDHDAVASVVQEVIEADNVAILEKRAAE